MLHSDPEKTAYWEELFPNDKEWRVIQDMKVLDVLQRHGDDSSVTRRIDHWLYFPDAAGRDGAAAWAVQNGFTLQGKMDPEGDNAEYGVQIYHDARPELPAITAITALLSEKAEEFGGYYDGWETHVESPGDRDPGAQES